MKLNLSVLALASILLSSPVSAARVDVDFDHPGHKPWFDLADDAPGFKSEHHFDNQKHQDKKTDFEFKGRFNPHHDADWLNLRNFHADGRGLQGLSLSNSCVVIETSPVPLPAAGWLFISGLAGIIGLSRRRKQHKD